MTKIKIVIRNTHFTVKYITNDISHIAKIIGSNLTTYRFSYDYRTKRSIREKDKTYQSYDPVFDIYRYNINMLKDFMLVLGQQNISREELSITYDKTYVIEPINVEANPKYTPREYQESYIEALLQKDGKTARLVDLATGGGKGLIASVTVTRLNMRLGIVVLPKYIEKWIGDITEYTQIDLGSIYVVKGGSSLRNLLEDEYEYDVVIFSMTTLSNYIKDYQKDPETTPVYPQDLIEHLKIGTVLSDETHQSFHSLFNIMLYLNPVRMIGLSATLDNNDSNIKRMYNIMFPPDARISNLIEYKRYFNVIAVRYYIEMNKRIAYKRPQGYNHHLYEQSIRKMSVFLKGYIEMIGYYLDKYFMKIKKDNQRCLIFLASINLCTIFTNYFTNKYKELDVRRYVEDDPYENVIEADICFSTVLSSGTAIDIPGLVTVIQTVSIGSLQSNLQAIGRLREIKDSEVRYVYLYCGDIADQVRLHFTRKDIVLSRSKTFTLEEYPIKIKTS